MIISWIAQTSTTVIPTPGHASYLSTCTFTPNALLSDSYSQWSSFDPKSVVWGFQAHSLVQQRPFFASLILHWAKSELIAYSYFVVFPI